MKYIINEFVYFSILIEDMIEFTKKGLIERRQYLCSHIFKINKEKHIVKCEKCGKEYSAYTRK